MAQLKGKPARIAGGSVPDAESIGEIASGAAPVAEQREDSASRVAEKREGIELALIGSVIWEEFKDELEKLQYKLVKNYGALRIANATVPVKIAPATHETGHGEIIITKGEGFSALLTDGTTIKAE